MLLPEMHLQAYQAGRSKATQKNLQRSSRLNLTGRDSQARPHEESSLQNTIDSSFRRVNTRQGRQEARQ